MALARTLRLKYSPGMRLDSHQHFWSYTPIEYPWIPQGSPLERNWLPPDLDAAQGPHQLDGSIAVQARQSHAETEWLLQLASQFPRIQGVVGWIDLRAPNVAEIMDRFAAHPKLVGVRHVVQDEPDDRFLLGSDFIRGIASLQKVRLTYDLLVYPHQLPACIELVEQFPHQRFVLDHCAKPRIRDGLFSPWREHLRRLAQFPNVWCKVSGLITEANHQRWRFDQLQPFLEIVAAEFGPKRLMFGSDWPVCLLAGSYSQWVSLADHWTQHWSSADRNAFWGETCAAFYLSGR